jgi:membrane-associated protease RseP (regulator of RpoE activity)
MSSLRSSDAVASAAAPARALPTSRLRIPAWRTPDLKSLARRLAHFWLVWSALLLIHEAGHALSAWRQGHAARRITVGAGPVLWREHVGSTEIVHRLVPIAGMTTLHEPADPQSAIGWAAWRSELVTLTGGVVATLVLAVGLGGLVAARERRTGTRCVWGRVLVADAIVLTVFNFLPVPPLDGGRAVTSAIAAWRGAPLPKEALFWVQAGGLALAVVPMTLWTRWTARIDAAALWWGAPRAPRTPPVAG